MSEVEMFVRWFKAELKERELSQEAAAREIGVSLKTVQRWVGGQSTPRYKELTKIRKAWKTLPPI